MSKRVSALDGLRGTAVAAVVAYHLGLGWATGGYLGVDTFLVLSGYLITTGLIAEHARRGGVSLRAFWGRRIRRLVPALTVLLAAAAVYCSVAALPDEAHRLRVDGLTSLAFISNWRYILTGQGYFAHSAAPSLLRHTWSLGVEAQLYLVWPAVVIGVLARHSRRTVAAIAALLACASAGWAMVLARSGGNLTRAYYGTDTRAAAFLLGAAVAAALAGPARDSRWRARTTCVMAVAGAATTAAVWWRLEGTSQWLFRGGLALAGVATAAIVWDVVRRPAGLAARSLSLGPLPLLGRVSYGVYLWHWPLFGLLNQRSTGLAGAALVGVRLGATAAATTLSWLLVERPILAGGPCQVSRRWHRPLTAGLAAGLTAALVTPALTVGAAATPRPASLAVIHASAPSPPPSGGPSVQGAQGALADHPRSGRALAADQARSGPTPAPALAPVRAVVFGDSVAATLAAWVAPWATLAGVELGNGATVGCGVALGTALRTIGDVAQTPSGCRAWAARWQARVNRDRPAVVIILLGRWEVLDRVVDGRWQHIGQPSYDAYLSAQLDQAIVVASSTGATVLLSTAPYFQGAERPQGGIWPENDPARVDRWNMLIREAVARHPGVALYDLNAVVSPGGRFASTVAGHVVRSSDGVHFSAGGGAYIATTLLPTILTAAHLVDQP